MVHNLNYMGCYELLLIKDEKFVIRLTFVKAVTTLCTSLLSYFAVKRGYLLKLSSMKEKIHVNGDTD